MNRHQRRASSKKQAASSHSTSHSLEDSSVILDPSISRKALAQHENNKPSFFLRLISGILLSRFVLARVKQPEVEKLLMRLAIETHRQEVIDELVRREAMHTINAKK